MTDARSLSTTTIYDLATCERLVRVCDKFGIDAIYAARYCTAHALAPIQFVECLECAARTPAPDKRTP